MSLIRAASELRLALRELGRSIWDAGLGQFIVWLIGNPLAFGVLIGLSAFLCFYCVVDTVLHG